MSRCAADDVMAVQRSLQRDRVEEVLGELVAEAAEARSRVSWLQFAAGLKAEPDGIADILVRFAEGYALVRKIGRGSHGVEISGLGRGTHPIEPELESASETVEEPRRMPTNSISSIEDRFLTFLQVLIVGERKSLESACVRVDGCAEETTPICHGSAR